MWAPCNHLEKPTNPWFPLEFPKKSKPLTSDWLAEMAFPSHGHGNGADPEAPATEVTSSYRVGNAKGGEFLEDFTRNCQKCRLNRFHLRGNGLNQQTCGFKRGMELWQLGLVKTRSCDSGGMSCCFCAPEFFWVFSDPQIPMVRCSQRCRWLGIVPVTITLAILTLPTVLVSVASWYQSGD